ncbi:MAG: acylneuraminate cytidylyltransferase family protein [Candidatus Delongbacteria bacterium]|nr:acylneuraminate cytidylyltransferase family protein [Candidatus Delongbacteria bacterium]
MKIWAVIPARGGSRGIPDKNLRQLNGKSLLAHTLQSAQIYGGFERILVSTDSLRIRQEAEQWGGAVPFMRPAALAQDDTPTLPVVLHLLEQFPEQELPEALCMLQVTSPLRRVEHIARAVRLLEQNTADAIVSVSTVRQHPYWMKKVSNNFLVPLMTEGKSHRRQDLPPAWFLNGALYLVRTEHLLRFHTVIADRTLPLIMDAEDSIDIDTELDFKLAELLMQERATNACIV